MYYTVHVTGFHIHVGFFVGGGGGTFLELQNRHIHVHVAYFLRGVLLTNHCPEIESGGFWQLHVYMYSMRQKKVTIPSKLNAV